MTALVILAAALCGIVSLAAIALLCMIALAASRIGLRHRGRRPE